jgi:hypothetical protein
VVFMGKTRDACNGWTFKLPMKTNKKFQWVSQIFDNV